MSVVNPASTSVATPNLQDVPAHGTGALPIWTSITHMPRENLALRTTAILLILYGSTGWVASVGLAVIAALMLLHPRFIWSAVLWLAAIAVMTISNADSWYAIDNHKYLILYWTIGCAMAVGAGSAARQVLAVNARLLIGLCFGFAMYWKIMGGEYINGVFLHTTFLLDGRLLVPVSLISGMSLEEVATNGWLVSLLRDVATDGASVPALTNDRLRLLALASSYWTLLIEGLVALTFLLSSLAVVARQVSHGARITAIADRVKRVTYARDWLLLAFVLTTYFLLPVVPFAMILCIMGLSQVEQHRTRAVTAYFIALGIIQLTMIPWQSYLVGFGLVN